MIKRFFDFILSFLSFLFLIPILLPVCIMVFLQDYKSPFYIAPRVGLNEKIFNMIKLRSMIINADKSGVDSTSSDDSRITPIGKFIRKFKLDELTQIINVFFGQMSFVGPRPNVKRETDLYTNVEKKLLLVRPGITDFSSIIFSDEGDILKSKQDPDLSYNQLIRPWKSRLGIFYIDNKSFFLDIKLIYITALSIISRKNALIQISKILKQLNADPKFIDVALRNNDLIPTPPPGSNKIVSNRNI